jgi:7,8-dihydropterin-6-yl-methyl-4-(beta-D-ribofuranosyl)aminobenzene 5'-phosphate synthase
MKMANQGDVEKTLTLGGFSLCLDSAFTAQSMGSGPHDLKAVGACRRISVTCISEVGWWDTQVILADIVKAGGLKDADQWTGTWNSSNAAGSCSLVQVESLSGAKIKFLVDAGWNISYMEDRFKAEGIDRMLRDGEIEFLYLTHEHLDHLWGIEAVLKYNPEIKIIIPDSFQSSAIDCIKAAESQEGGRKNSIPHKGEIIRLKMGELTKLMEGVVSIGFDVPIIMKIRGEQSLYFNVEEAGLVLFTGCCHQNIVTFADYAVDNLNARGKLFGLYGGLHIAPFGNLGDQENSWIEEIGSYGFKKIAANHCTGLPAVHRMLELGYPLVKGTGSKGSQSDLYIGNGDSILFE